MSGAPELDDLARRLADLADSAGPWDDPLPEVYRRAASTVPPGRGSAAVLSSARTRARRRWWPTSLNLVTVASAAAVVSLVALLGWVILSGGGATDSKSSSSEAAGTGHGSSGAGAGGGQRSSAQPHPEDRTKAAGSLPGYGCGWSAPSAALGLTAPARVRTGAAFTLHVRVGPTAGTEVAPPVVAVLRDRRFVGRLVPSTVRPGPRVRTMPARSHTRVLTGTLRASTCAQLTALTRPSAGPRPLAGLALTPGRYQLIVVATGTAGTVVSAPVTVTVTH